MELAYLISKLASQFQNPLFELPGFQTQIQLSPRGRETLLKSLNNDYIDSAVMILLFPDENRQAKSLFIERKVYEGVHSGQIGLPGGKFEPNDMNLLQTAIRETEEETGFRIESEKIIGRLTPLQIPVSSFEVTPVIAYTEKVPKFVANENEVEKIIEFSIDKLIKAEILEGEFLTINGIKVKAPYYNLDGIKIWGATSMIIAEFLEILK